MHIDTIIADIRARWKNYDAQGFINDDSCYSWAKRALKPFGVNIMELQETLVYVKNGKATLPEGFYSLHDALTCEADYYCTSNINKEDTALVDSLFWKERTERKISWDSCDSCCKEESETVIKERIYLDMSNSQYVDFFYNTPQRLKLKKNLKRGISDSCRNKYVTDSKNTIDINGTTMYTNFTEGTVYIQYYGVEVDEDGKPIIPDTPHGHIRNYIEEHLKLNILEDIIANKDDANAINLFKLTSGKENNYKTLAMTDAKFSKLSPKSFKRLRNINRIDSMKYELFFPEVQNY